MWGISWLLACFYIVVPNYYQTSSCKSVSVSWLFFMMMIHSFMQPQAFAGTSVTFAIKSKLTSIRIVAGVHFMSWATLFLCCVYLRTYHRRSKHLPLHVIIAVLIPVWIWDAVRSIKPFLSENYSFRALEHTPCWHFWDARCCDPFFVRLPLLSTCLIKTKYMRGLSQSRMQSSLPSLSTWKSGWVLLCNGHRFPSWT